MANPEEMYQCQMVNCGYIYNPDMGDRKGKIKKGTGFNELPDDWRCPVCGASAKAFKPLAGPGSVADQDKEQAPASDKAGGKPGAGKYRCIVCGDEYDPTVGDPENNIEAGTSFYDFPDDWGCPVCGAGTEEFGEVE